MIKCRKLPEMEGEDLESVRQVFQAATVCEMRQSWLKRAESDFGPGKVRIGWRNGALMIFGEFSDMDIFTKATGHNQRFWELGDTFEIFLRPMEQQAYLEFHVTPDNRRLQLRFTDSEMVEHLRKADKFEDAMIEGQVFNSKTWVHPEAHQWSVIAEVPASSVCEKIQPMEGSEWAFSFSRYDFTRGRKEPVISSTSAHTKPNFHCQPEWGVMRFEP